MQVYMTIMLTFGFIVIYEYMDTHIKIEFYVFHPEVLVK